MVDSRVVSEASARGHDVVAVSAVRPRAGEEASVPETTTALLDAAAETGTVLLLVGGAGPLSSPERAPAPTAAA